MPEITKLVSGVLFALEHSSDWSSVWEFCNTDQSAKLIYNTQQLEQLDEYRKRKAELIAESQQLIQQCGGDTYKKCEDKIEQNFGELYIDSITPIQDSKYLILRYSAVPFPFQMAHRSRSKRVSQLEKQISRNIIHELLTPINSIQGLNEQLGEAILDDSTKTLLAMHAASCLRLKTHISELVNSIGLSTCEARGYLKTDFDLFDTIFSVSSKANRSISQNGRSLSFELAYPTQLKCLPITGYPKLLEQLLLHLLDNAIKFTPDGGRICMNLELQGDSFLQFSIADNGCGIDENLINVLFRPFILGDMRDTRQDKGLGLGLSSARDCLIIMTGNENAKINLTQTEGGGATFTFKVLYEKSDINISDQRGSLQLPKPPVEYHILVAEDNPTQQMIITRLIKKLGFRYTLVGNGVEVVGEFLRADRCYDLVLMDIQMPGISGHEATRMIRKIEQRLCRGTDLIPIIAITANIENEVHVESLKAGMNGHYGKPVTRVVLNDLIRKSILGIALSDAAVRDSTEQTKHPDQAI